jgi:hypothetical protein
VRFEVSRVLDAIERRLSTDPMLARGVVDLAEAIRYVDLDGGRPATMLRLGMVIDALGRQLAEENVPVYVVADRALLSEPDLSSNERMVLRRWADDGLVEVLPKAGERVLEVAEMIGLPVLSRSRFEAQHKRYPWLADEPARLLAPLPGTGGASLLARIAPVAGRRPPGPSKTGAALLARLWRCPDPDCGNFGPARVGRPGGQPPPRLRSGVPVCPRHDARLADAGPRPPAEVLAVRVGGVIRQRFLVAADRPVVVGRAPAEERAVMVGQWLTDEARRWISRSHVRLELRGQDLVARDISTNGTAVRQGGSMTDADRVLLTRDQTRVLAETDVLELYPGVHIGRANRWSSGGVLDPGSVMSDAPTMTLRVVNR